MARVEAGEEINLVAMEVGKLEEEGEGARHGHIGGLPHGDYAARSLLRNTQWIRFLVPELRTLMNTNSIYCFDGRFCIFFLFSRMS